MTTQLMMLTPHRVCALALNGKNAIFDPNRNRQVTVTVLRKAHCLLANEMGIQLNEGVTTDTKYGKPRPTFEVPKDQSILEGILGRHIQKISKESGFTFIKVSY